MDEWDAQMATDASTATGTSGAAGAPPPPPPPPPPIAVNGAGSPIGTPVIGMTPDGKPTRSDLLYDNGRTGDDQVRITRERVTGGNQFDDVMTLHTGDRDDDIRLSQRPDGVLAATVNGQAYELTLGRDQELGVRSNGGNDRIIASNTTPALTEGVDPFYVQTVASAGTVRVDMDVRGGDGDDVIITGSGNDRVDGGRGDDTILTGNGRDDVSGGAGNDRIDAGAGNDVVYGGDDNDRIRGGRGNDVLDGGRGNDVIDGEEGRDVLSGGLGNDTLRGGADVDHIYAGAGTDTVHNSGGQDVVYGRAGEDTVSAAEGAGNRVVDPGAHDPSLGSSILISGSDSFRERVEADLEQMRGSPAGRQMLAALDQAAAAPPVGKGNAVTIAELTNETNGAAGGHPAGPGQPLQMHDDMFLEPDPETGAMVAGAGTPAMVHYNPSFHSDHFPAPGVILQHELSHAYNVVNGTLQPDMYRGADTDGRSGAVGQWERQAVGLPHDGASFDFDNDPATPPTQANPAPLTENAVRREMGLPDRTEYSVGPGALVSPGQPNAAPASAHPHTHGAHLDALFDASRRGDDAALGKALEGLMDSDAGRQFQQRMDAAAERGAPAPEHAQGRAEPVLER